MPSFPVPQILATRGGEVKPPVLCVHGARDRVNPAAAVEKTLSQLGGGGGGGSGPRDVTASTRPDLRHGVPEPDGATLHSGVGPGARACASVHEGDC